MGKCKDGKKGEIMPTVRVYSDGYYLWNRRAERVLSNFHNESYNEAVSINQYTNTGVDDSKYKEDHICFHFDFTPLNGRKTVSATAAINIRKIYKISGSGFALRYGPIAGEMVPGGVPPREDATNDATLSVGRQTLKAFGQDYYTLREGILSGIVLYPYVKDSQYINGEMEKDFTVNLYTGLDGVEENKVYMDVEYESPQPYPTEHLPESGASLSRHRDNTFSWKITADKIIGPMSQQAFKFRWRKQGESSYQEYEIISADSSYIVPADTFTADVVEWQVQVQSADGVWSDAQEWLTLTTADSLSSAACESPVNEFLDSGVENVFVWKHIIETGTAQTKAELQYSADDTSWFLFATAEGPGTSITIMPDILPGGKLSWRVRTYNSDGIAGAWSAPAAIVVQGAPPAPIIAEITNSSRPAIWWQSLGQVAYHVTIKFEGKTVVDTGECYGTDKVYKSNDYITDGTYMVQVRIKSSSGMWSKWASREVTISTDKPMQPDVSYNVVENGISVHVENFVDYISLYLLRDGMPVGKLNNGEFTDFAATSDQQYCVRGIGPSDSFADSVLTTVKWSLKSGAKISSVDHLNEPFQLRLKAMEPVRLADDIEIKGTQINYIGRKSPIYIFSPHTVRQFSISYTFTNADDWKRMRELANARKTVLYRDSFGNKSYCVLQSISRNQYRMRMDFTARLLVVDYDERVEYDPLEV